MRGQEATTERQIYKDRKTKRTDLGVKGVKELQGVNHYQGIKEIKKRRKNIEAFTIHVYIENLFKSLNIM